MPKISKPKKLRILKRDNYTCQYCGLILFNNQSNIHIDHKKAKSLEGSGLENNLQVSCSKCNLLKSNLSIKKFRVKVINLINKKVDEINHFLPKKASKISNYEFYFEKNGRL